MRSVRRGRPERVADPGSGDATRRGTGRIDLPPPLPLAYGELTEQDVLELRSLKEQIRDESGLFCEGYKEKCLRRRLAVRMRARGVHRYADYARLLDGDPGEYAKLLDAITINVSKFYRNPEVWEAVRTIVLPEIFRKEGPVRLWSAGTATGEEPYTLAMLVRDYLESVGRTSELERVDIEATDIDQRALDRARQAMYPPLALVETPDSARARWFEPGGPPFRVKDDVRRMVRFRRGDLIRDAAPASLDLIICRNVFIYFEREVQETLLERFTDALVPGGWLVLGKVETLLGPVAPLLESVRARERIYRKR